MLPAVEGPSTSPVAPAVEVRSSPVPPAPIKMHADATSRALALDAAVAGAAARWLAASSPARRRRPAGRRPAAGSQAHVDARYQYLSGGVNTGHGWATWNPDGTFASMYVRESIAAHMIPVLTYYQLLQSQPAVGSTEMQKDLSNLSDPATMRAYWNDYRLLLRRVGNARRTPPGDHPYRTRPVGLPRAGARDRARALVRQEADRVAQPARSSCAARLASERLGNRGRSDLHEALARAYGCAGGEVGGVLRVARHAIRSRVQRRHRPGRRFLPVRRGQSEHVVGTRPTSVASTRTSPASRGAPALTWCSGNCRWATRCSTTPGATTATTACSGG
jgi:hypothetical protein